MLFPAVNVKCENLGGLFKLKERFDGVDQLLPRIALGHPQTTMTGTTTFPMREDATGSPEDAAPFFLRCVLCSLLLTETEAEISDGVFRYYPET